MSNILDGFSGLVAILLIAVGLYFLLRLKGFYLFHPLRCTRVLLRRRVGTGISPLRALTVALAGTLGVGNIVGVASALLIGGPGAVLWMVLGALVAMVLKYAEITLTMRHRPDPATPATRPAGAHTYIRNGLTARGVPRLGRGMATLFAALCLVNAVTMGGILQVNAAAGAMAGAFALPHIVTGVAMAALVLLVLRGESKTIVGEKKNAARDNAVVRRVSALTEWLVPLMTAAFLAACVAVLVLRRERLGEALRVIWTDAVSPSAVGGGLGGLLISRGIRAGIMRGLVSNEAGAGTAPMAHAAADNDSPAAQGVFGLAEVFVDTVLLCTVTALAILVSDAGAVLLLPKGTDALASMEAVELARRAFQSVLGPFSGGFFAISILLFAAATVLCWGHYGSVCVSVLFGENAWAHRIFLVVFALGLPLGAVFAPRFAWMLADGVIGVMTVINLVMMFLLRREISEETERAGLLHGRSQSERE